MDVMKEEGVKHCPTPWRYDGHGYIWSADNLMIADFDDEQAYLARMRGVGAGMAEDGRQDANAAFIVCACNNHAPLLAAIEIALESINLVFRHVQLTPSLDGELDAARGILRAAIAKATEKRNEDQP